MYRPGKPPLRPPPFGAPPPPPGGPHFRLGLPCTVPPPGHLPPVSFSAMAPDSHCLLNRPSSGHFIRPHCSNFSSGHSTVIALDERQQIRPPTEPLHTQVPQWNPALVERHLPNNSDRAGEEFLRCIAANKPLPDYLKGNMAYNLADAFQSASVLKEAVKLDPEFQRHVTKSKSRSRSRRRSQSRGKSRGRSRAKSRAKSRARSKSRACSRSRGRSKSCARGRSRAKSKSRTHSVSRSQSRSKRKSRARSKNHDRKSKTRSSSGEKSYGNDNKRKRSPSHSRSSAHHAGNSLLDGLKLVMNSKELEERLPTLKDAILTIQASDDKVESMPDDQRHRQVESQENSTPMENDSMLLPHDRVGSDFSWLQSQTQEDAMVQRSDELEDEESFLYGNEAQEMDCLGPGNPQHHQNKSIHKSFGDQTPQNPPSFTPASLDSKECEKIKNILRSLGTADISEIMLKMQRQKMEQLSPTLLCSDQTPGNLALPAVSEPNVRQALQSLQSLIKATKEKRAKREGSCTSQTFSDTHQAGDSEERKREEQARISKMESLMKELEGLLKQDGLCFLTPVIGFYCQKCEEFIGDLKIAKNHAALHLHGKSSTQNVQMDTYAGDSTVHLCYSSSSSNHPRPSDTSDLWAYGHLQDAGDYRKHSDSQCDLRDEHGHKSKHNIDHRSYVAGHVNISLKEEMRKERMLITVSRGQTPLPNVRHREEANKDLPEVRIKDKDNKGQSSKGSNEKNGKPKGKSSDKSDDGKGKPLKSKSPKKKKKKKEKKRKERADKS